MPPLASFDVKFIPGIGPARSAILGKELDIYSLRDLLRYYPYKHIDRSRLYHVSDVEDGMPYVQLIGQIRSFEQVGEGRGMRLVAHFWDGTGFADLVWFQGAKYAAQRYHEGVTYVVFGKPALYKGRVNIAHPDVDEADKVELQGMGLKPYYITTDKMKRSGLNSRAMERIMTSALKAAQTQLMETLPGNVMLKARLMGYPEAISQIHFPESTDLLRKAQYRLKFEELFYVQLQILRYAGYRRDNVRGHVFSRVGEHFNTFYSHHLPFSLTQAQKRVIREIRKDMGSGRQMNRLLQGDVGSGKTMVALLCMLLALDNHHQACLMAPTEILAQQHFESISALLEKMSLRVELLTGSVKGARRKQVLEDLESGKVDILIGTHALIEDPVTFSSLGLAIIDEQHRFGVAQRARLWHKGATPPHILVMTATPIPRTLAMTLYGDLDVSVIDELPPGRKPVETVHQMDTRRESLNRFIAQQIDMGRQAYVVYPLIKESEKIDLKNLEDGYKQLTQIFPQYRISKVHGQMKPQEKDEQMRLFQSGETQILVATTVIEVGVNVPNASVMVIENAERFGLSQLHQLRGRVGRGADQSYCILVTRANLSEDTKRRMEVMTATTDGFEIAEADLRLRGPGDLEGTQQSGVAFDLRIADLAHDGIILQTARDLARECLEADPDLSLPENAVLKQQLALLKNGDTDWGMIS